ncbi:hypothetical protein CspHIS471_0606670 [Cutaneotrichosporon sp. HIS471]|nr:hypothetical protein CspHIS471_0606670 [Cutaneotrichosporon sp. HIS471]
MPAPTNLTVRLSVWELWMAGRTKTQIRDQLCRFHLSMRTIHRIVTNGEKALEEGVDIEEALQPSVSTGRPRMLDDEAVDTLVQEVLDNSSMTLQMHADKWGVSPATITKALEDRDIVRRSPTAMCRRTGSRTAVNAADRAVVARETPVRAARAKTIPQRAPKTPLQRDPKTPLQPTKQMPLQRTQKTSAAPLQVRAPSPTAAETPSSPPHAKKPRLC